MAESSGQTNLENISDSIEADEVENSELRETNVKGSEEVFEMYCETCNRDGMHVPAYAFCISCVAYFCSTCLKYHGKFLPGHKYLEGDKLPHDICTEKCCTHASEILKFYCTTCCKFVCTVCKTNDHTDTCAMNYLPDLVKDFETGEDIDELMSSRNGISKRLSDTLTVIDTNYERIHGITSQIKYAINKEKEELFTNFDEEVLKMEKKVLKTKNDLRADSLRKDFESLDTNINALLDSIKRLPSAPKSRRYKLYIELKQLGSELKKVNEAVEGLKKECFSSNDELECELEVQAKDLTENVKKFGTELRKCIEKSEETVEDKPVKLACPLDDINVRADGDRENCSIIDCCVLSEQYLIVCDRNNKSLKLVDTKIKKLLYVRLVKSSPFSVTKISDTEFAMVQSYHADERRSVIQFLTLTKAKTLVFQKRHILTEMCCCGIAYINGGRLVISMSLNHEGKVQMLNMKGNVLANIEVNSEGNIIFRCPYDIALDAETKYVYVSDWYEDKIIEIDLSNQTTREIAYSFWHPEGITTDKEGCVYVIEAGTNRIHYFHPKADDVKTRVQFLFSSVYKLLGIFYSVADNKLYVGCDGYDCIQVYRIDDKKDVGNRQ